MIVLAARTLFLRKLLPLKKVNLSVKSHTDIDTKGKRGSFDKASRTIDKSHVGKVGFLGDLIFKHAF